jgi:hypothetical protein
LVVVVVYICATRLFCNSVAKSSKVTM